MRATLAIILFITLCHQLVLKLAIIAWYQYNKEYISQTLCENRDRPALKCCGKCVLRKKLAKADSANSPLKPISERLAKGKISPFILPAAFCLAGTLAEENRLSFHYQERSIREITGEIFHPPG